MTSTKIEKNNLTAVRLYAPTANKTLRYCETCNSKLEQWFGGRGRVWLCPTCRKVIE